MTFGSEYLGLKLSLFVSIHLLTIKFPTKGRDIYELLY